MAEQSQPVSPPVECHAGEFRAEEIVKWRARRGRFENAEDLQLLQDFPAEFVVSIRRRVKV